MKRIDDRLVYKSTWGTSRKITLADALDEMDVQEFEETPIIVFTDPDQSYYHRGSVLSWLRSIRRLITTYYTEQSKYFKDFEGPPRPSRPQADHTYETNEFRTQSPSDPVSRNEFEDSPWFYTHVENSPYSLFSQPPRPKTPVPFRPSKTFIPSKHY